MLKRTKKVIKMFEEDFFEAEELQVRKNRTESDAETFDVSRYIRALK